MTINTQKYLVGIMGLILLGSVIAAGYLDSERRKKENIPAALAGAEAPLSPDLQRGFQLYEQLSCVTCHGAAGKGGVHNINAQTGQEVPALIHSADSYTKADLIAKIRAGVPVSAKLNPDGPVPPLHMPAFKDLLGSDEDMEALVKYLYSLKPKGEDVGF